METFESRGARRSGAPARATTSRRCWRRSRATTATRASVASRSSASSTPTSSSDVAAHDPDEGLRKAAIEKAEEVLVSAAVAGDERALDALGKLGQPRLLGAGGAARRPTPPCARARVAHPRGRATTRRSPRWSEDVDRRDAAPLHRRLARGTRAPLRDVAISDGNKEIALAAVARLDDRAALDKVVQQGAVQGGAPGGARQAAAAGEEGGDARSAEARAPAGAGARGRAGRRSGRGRGRARAFLAEGADDEMRRRFDRTCERFYAKRARDGEEAGGGEGEDRRAAASRPRRRAEAGCAGRAAASAEGAACVEVKALPSSTKRRDKRRAAEREARRKRSASAATPRRPRRAPVATPRRRRTSSASTQLADELEAVTVDDLKRGARRAQARAAGVRRARPARPRRRCRRRRAGRRRATSCAPASASCARPRTGSAGPTCPSWRRCASRAEALLEETDLPKAAGGAQGAARRVEGGRLRRRRRSRRRCGRASRPPPTRCTSARARTSPSLDEQRGAQPDEEGGARRARRGARRLQRLEGDRRAHQGAAGGVEGARPGAEGQGATRCGSASAAPATSSSTDVRRISRLATPNAPANLAKQETLIAAVEKLAASTDWKRTGDEIKALQADWKTIGPVPRDKSEETWKRFRGACDRFFDARKVHFDKLDEERGANLKAKELLCEKVEALGDAPDVDEAIERRQDSCRPSGAPSARRRRTSPTTCGTASAPPATRSSTARAPAEAPPRRRRAARRRRPKRRPRATQRPKLGDKLADSSRSSAAQAPSDGSAFSSMHSEEQSSVSGSPRATRLRQPGDLARAAPAPHLRAVATGVLVPRDLSAAVLAVDRVEQRRRRAELLPPGVPGLFRFGQALGVDSGRPGAESRRRTPGVSSQRRVLISAISCRCKCLDAPWVTF